VTHIRTAAFAVAILAATPVFAQTAQDPHHPDAATSSTEAQAAPPPGTMPGPGMMGRDRAGAMMGQDGGMMGYGMMGDMMAGGMMENMRGMMAMMGAGMRSGARHIEGRLAYLKTELKITDAQAPQWNAFADAVRANAKAMTGMHQQAASQGGPKTLPERLTLLQKAMTAHLEALNKTSAALSKLYDALSAEQKKVADEIVVGPMGMPMGMM
jgi:hypothetical protein